MFKFILPIALLATFAYGGEPSTSSNSHRVQLIASLNEHNEDDCQYLDIINELLRQENANDFSSTIAKEGYLFVIKQCNITIDNSSRRVRRILNQNNQYLIASAIRHLKLRTMINLYDLNIFNNDLNIRSNFKVSDFGSVMNRFANELKDVFFKRSKNEISMLTRETYRYLKVIADHSTVRVSGLVAKKHVPPNMPYPLGFKYEITFGNKKEGHIQLESYF
ncbi:conserved rodent malaria protein, unknown function [Plasmodium chabaudi chabaudi]|uniref:Fam-d protein n=1 Tax=Plasmodium chabaudi chabaudi TaxID=31271 RepID=A0A1C6YEQ2_PLACU|nr:conserved rodent malaria protein, unknown function [Plasmodium chabaudi chabaudi]